MEKVYVKHSENCAAPRAHGHEARQRAVHQTLNKTLRPMG